MLIGDPSVLILDEPANGLDPQGIIWMRELLRRFANDGGTVLLSSHLLNEVEVIADRLLLIDKGKLVAVGLQGRAPRDHRDRGAEPRSGRRSPRRSRRPASSSRRPTAR